MSTNSNRKKTKLEPFLWTVVVVIIALGIAANYYFAHVSTPIVLAGWIVLLVIAALVAAQTSAGFRFRQFARESRIELRKVIWPTKQETIQTTVVVFIMVLITALVIWGVDSLLIWLIGWLTGQRG